MTAALGLVWLALAGIAGLVTIVVTGHDVPAELWPLVTATVAGAAGAAVPQHPRKEIAP